MNEEHREGWVVAQPPKHELRTELKFVCRQYVGQEVLCCLDRRPITSKEELREGMDVLVPGGFTANLFKTVVDSVTGDTATAHCGDIVFSLQFGKDDRQCWICMSRGSMKAISKVKFV